MTIPNPPNWVPHSIGELVLKTKQRNPSLEPNDYIEYVDVSSVSNSLYKIVEHCKLIGKDAPSRARKVIEHNDILFATVRPTLKRIAIVPANLNDQICSTGYCVLKPNPANTHYGFLYYYLLTDFVTKKMESIQRGASYPAIRDSDLKKLIVPLPPLPEQRKIASILSTVQKAIENQQALIDRTTELKKAMMHKLFTEGTKGEKQKMTEIGLVPESWELVKFDHFATLQRGKDLPKYSFIAGKYPVVGATTFIGYHNAFNAKGPGVTVVRSGSSAGMPLYIKEDFWAHNVVLYVKDFHSNIPKFAYYKIADLDLTKYKAGVAVPTLNRNTFSSIQIAIPLKGEQTRIVDILDNISDKINRHQLKKRKLEDLFRTLLHQLMTCQITVNDINLS